MGFLFIEKNWTKISLDSVMTIFITIPKTSFNTLKNVLFWFFKNEQNEQR